MVKIRQAVTIAFAAALLVVAFHGASTAQDASTAQEQNTSEAYAFSGAGAAHIELPDFNYGSPELVHGQFDDVKDSGFTINGGFGFRLPHSIWLGQIGVTRIEFGFGYLKANIKASNSEQPTGGAYFSADGTAAVFSFASGRGTLDTSFKEAELSNTLYFDDGLLGLEATDGGLEITPFVRTTLTSGGRDTRVDMIDSGGSNDYFNYVEEKISSIRLGAGAGLEAKVPLSIGGAYVALRVIGGLTYISADAYINDCAANSGNSFCNGDSFATTQRDSLSKMSYHARAEGQYVVPLMDNISIALGGWVETLERPQVVYPDFVGDSPAYMKLRRVNQAGVMGRLIIELGDNN